MTHHPHRFDAAHARALAATASRRAAQALVAGFAAWLLSACGGGGSADPAAPGTPATLIAPVTTASAHRVVTLDHGAFTLRYDCDERSTVRYSYTLGVDTGNAARPTVFALGDPQLPADCAQQTRTATYASVAPGWDRGHLVTANHMDASDALIAQTFWMTNIVPQRSLLNQGIWADAEAIAECYRDLAPVQVVGGVVYGDGPTDTANDWFVASHGIRTPERFWMVLVTQDANGPKAIAWSIPNTDALGALDSYLVSIAALEAQVGADAVGLPVLSSDLKAQRASASWPLPVGCNPG
ncbi:MAG: DNA/RNA non-specific endonuclease [Leptothrix sp. (in: b-proteobacteria)]